uniref:Protein PTCD3 homolog, mitochondrial-like isoform X2 n=1 Tax=Crassostrea virginica TaxID=6565 RepID=A0A8B8ESF5_CRAVI|nr:protein PTCD3 homolog, mitochondrial-like isoform X2 [Crassostrea virginica]
MGTCMRGSNLFWKAKLLQRLQLIQCASCSQLQNSMKGSYPKISPPMKIERSPTAVLEALEETVGYECRSHGKFHTDDPYLYYPQFRKAFVMLAQSSGRKTAKLVSQMYAPLFEGTPAHTPLEPPTEAFSNLEANDDNLDASIKGNIQIGNLNRVLHHCSIMKNEDNFQILSNETYQMLIHFLSFHEQNYSINLEPEEVDLLDSINMVSKRSDEDVPFLLETLIGLDREKTPELYNSYLCSFFKLNFNEVAGKAKDMYKVMEDSKIPLEKRTYHSILTRAPYLTGLDTIEAVKTILERMKAAGYSPSVETYNSALLGLVNNKEFNTDEAQIVHFSLGLIAEMKSLGLEPTLDTWSIFISQLDKQVFARGQDSSVIVIMNQVLDEIQDKKFPEVGLYGRKFLKIAMNVALFQQNLALAYRIDDIYKTGQNYKLVKDFDIFRQRLIPFVLAIFLEPDMSKVVSLCTSMQPKDDIQIMGAWKTFLEDLKNTKSFQFIPDLLPSFYSTKHCLPEVLDYLAASKQPAMVQLKITAYAEKLLEMMPNLMKNVRFFLRNMEQMLVIALNGDNINLAWKVFSFMQENRSKIVGEVINIAPYRDMLNYYIDADDLRNCAEIIKFVAKDCPPAVTKSFVQNVKMNVPMNDFEREQLEKIEMQATEGKTKKLYSKTIKV